MDEKRPQYEELKVAIESFGEQLERGREKYRAREKVTISAPFPCRIIGE